MTLEASVLKDDAVRATDTGYEVDVHLAWYRSLPLSCVEDVTVSVGGRTVPRDDVRVRHGDALVGLDDLAGMADELWFVQDPIVVALPDPAPAAPGTVTEVDVHLATRIPYIVIGPGMALVQRTHVTREVVVR